MAESSKWGISFGVVDALLLFCVMWLCVQVWRKYSRRKLKRANPTISSKGVSDEDMMEDIDLGDGAGPHAPRGVEVPARGGYI